MTHSQVTDVQAPNVFVPKVSVIVPVYNTELYVERAIISLMEQTLDDVQFIIIDDGSKDNSLNIIKQVIARYPEREGLVTLISRENRGVAATRAQGMELATGDYVIHLDSDDWAEHSWLQTMYIKAIENNADVVVCDYYNVFNSGIESVKQYVNRNPVECLKSLFLGKISNSNWNKLVSRKLFLLNNINFQDGHDIGEDLLVSFFVFLNAKIVAYVDKELYFYNNVNPQSISKVYSQKNLDDLVYIARLIESEIKCKLLSKEVGMELAIFKLNVKALFIINCSDNLMLLERGFEVFPELNSSILSSNIKLLKIVYILKRLKLTSFSIVLIRMRRLVLNR